METNLILSSSPHIHTRDSSRRIMLDVIIALLPAAIAGVIIFGAAALGIIAACVITALASEALFNLITHKKQTVGDLSAVVTGLLLALNLSTNVAIWQCVVGTAFAIVVVKCLFGGLGKNFANPAITGRVFMLLAFSSVAGGAKPVAVELVSSATPLELLAQGAENALLPGPAHRLCLAALPPGDPLACACHLCGHRVRAVPGLYRQLFHGPVGESGRRPVPGRHLHGHRLCDQPHHPEGEDGLCPGLRPGDFRHPLFLRLSGRGLLLHSGHEHTHPVH